jgi:TonB family protein
MRPRSPMCPPTVLATILITSALCMEARAALLNRDTPIGARGSLTDVDAPAAAAQAAGASQADRDAEALKQAKRYIEVDPTNPYPWLDLAVLSDNAGDNATAVTAHNNALALGVRLPEPTRAAVQRRLTQRAPATQREEASSAPPAVGPARSGPQSSTQSAAAGQPIRVGPGVPAPRKVHDVQPVYPAIALSARVEGIVIIEAIISASGSVQSAKVLRSIELLDAAALAAVNQWRYEPTTVNGVVVPVIMTVTVNFAINRSTQNSNTPSSPPTTDRAPINSGATAPRSSLPPLQLQDTNWFCSAKRAGGQEFDGFLQFRGDGTVKLVETVRRNWPDRDLGPGGSDRAILWPVLYPGYNSAEAIESLHDASSPGALTDRWASTPDEARFFYSLVGQVYRFDAKGGQLVGTFHRPDDRSADRYFQNPTTTSVFDVLFDQSASLGSIRCSPAKGWMQR